MRRWIAILLMTVLPLQYTWAVAANYCLDEQGAGARHFGHHVHPSHAEADAGQGHLAKAKVQADCGSDCGCAGHLCGAQLLPAALGELPEGMAGEQFNAVLHRLRPSSDPSRIERPNWPVSA